jgi:hypothetical protein
MTSNQNFHKCFKSCVCVCVCVCLNIPIGKKNTNYLYYLKIRLKYVNFKMDNHNFTSQIIVESFQGFE